MLLYFFKLIWLFWTLGHWLLFLYDLKRVNLSFKLLWRRIILDTSSNSLRIFIRSLMKRFFWSKTALEDLSVKLHVIRFLKPWTWMRSSHFNWNELRTLRNHSFSKHVILSHYWSLSLWLSLIDSLRIIIYEWILILTVALIFLRMSFH